MDKHRCVLVVDDEEEVREGIRRVVERAGYTCKTADNGVHALAILRACTVHAVISDHDMPAMDGVELLKLVSNRQPHVARILLTGRADAEVAVRALNFGQAFRFLRKPCSNSDLLTTLHFAFELCDAEVERRRLSAQVRRQEAVLAEIRTRFPGVLEEIEGRVSAPSC